LEGRAHAFGIALQDHWNAALAPVAQDLHPSASSLAQQPVRDVIFVCLYQSPAGFAPELGAAGGATIALSVTALRGSMLAVLASVNTPAASANTSNPSMQNISASTVNEGTFGVQQMVAAAGVEPARECPRPCYACYGSTAERQDYRCGSTQTPSHGYCSGSQGDVVQCSCNGGFSGQYCTPDAPPGHAPANPLIWWRYLLGVAGSGFTIVLSVYSARQHLVARMRKRHSHHGSLSMNTSSGSTDDNLGMPRVRPFDYRDRFTMSILRGRLKDGGQEVAALAGLLRPLRPRSPAESNEPSSGLVVKVQSAEEQEEREGAVRAEEGGGRSWSAINDMALSAAQRARGRSPALDTTFGGRPCALHRGGLCPVRGRDGGQRRGWRDVSSAGRG
jgi:hypothetical protein